ncbi:MAG: SpoIIE family protein phosphatase [Armatimonadota bacterium]|nr:SpoIIE family protein phosphatase [Armatimonadota bacterium]
MLRFNSIRTKLVLAFIAVIVPFLVLQIHSYKSRYASRRTIALASEMQMSITAAQAIREYLNDMRRQARMTGFTILQNENQWSHKKIRAYLAEVQKDDPALDFIGWVTPQGILSVGYPGTRPGVDITDREYYRQIKRGQTWAVSDLLISKVTKEPRFVGAYGIRNDQGRLRGIVIMVVDTKLLSSRLMISNGSSKDAIIVITDSTGRVVYNNSHPDLLWRERDWSKVPSIRRAMNQTSGYIYRARLPLTEEMLIGAQTPMPGTGWSVGAFSPVDEVMRPLREDFRRSMMLGLVVSLIVLMAILVIGNSFSKPIVDLSNAAVKIARGELSERVRIKSGDEIGILATQFNLMAENLEQVQKITNRLLTDVPLSDLFEALASGAAAVLGTNKAGVFLPDPGARGIKHAASCGLSPDYLEFIQDAPPLVPVGGRAAASLKTLVVDVRADKELAPYAELMEREDIGSIACIPLVTGENKLLGIISGYLASGQAPSREQMSALQFFAAQAAVALENAQLHKETRQRTRELQVLWEVGQAVALKLDLDDLATTLAERLSALVQADDCCLTLYEPESDKFTIIGSSVPEGTVCPPERASRCAASISQAYISQEVTTLQLKPNGQDQADLEAPEYVLLAPMTLHGQPTGCICLFRQKDSFTESDGRLVSAIAGVAAIAIENARSYGKERRIAETLQSSFLPPREFLHDRVEIAEVYRPALDEASVGGDFFDVLHLSNGRLGIVIADVAGKGLQAAVHTAMLKYMLQAYAYQGQSPAEVILSLNKAVAAQWESDSFVTLFFGVFDPQSEELVYANAGHEMPILYQSKTECCDMLDVTGPALAMAEDASYSQKTIQLPPGSVLVLYTDGISEAHVSSDFFGTEGIRRVIDEYETSSAREIADRIVEAASAYAQGHLHDDVALLVLRVREGKAGDER